MKSPKPQAPEEKSEAAKQDRHGIPEGVLEALMKNLGKPGDLTGPDGLLKRLTAALVERVLDAELTEHLGYPKHGSDEKAEGNSRNGHSKKRLRSDQGPLDIEVPRDRTGSFAPQLVKKHDRTFNGFDDKIVALYARGMSVADIQAHLGELYGTEVSPELISRATDAVLDELKAWQGRPLEAIYAVVYLDALVVKVRDGGTVQNKAAYPIGVCAATVKSATPSLPRAPRKRRVERSRGHGACYWAPSTAGVPVRRCSRCRRRAARCLPCSARWPPLTDSCACVGNALVLSARLECGVGRAETCVRSKAMFFTRCLLVEVAREPAIQ